MTEQEKKALSQAVATKYGVSAYRYIVNSFNEDLVPNLKETWLADDWARLMPLAVEQEVSFSHGVNGSITCWTKDKVLDDEVVDNGVRVSVDCKDHPTKERAVAVAILKTLKAKKEK